MAPPPFPLSMVSRALSTPWFPLFKWYLYKKSFARGSLRSIQKDIRTKFILFIVKGTTHDNVSKLKINL